MSDVLEAAGAACLFLVGSELVTRLWGEDKTLAFARGLAVLVVLLGLVGALFTGEWDLELPQAQGEAAGQELGIACHAVCLLAGQKHEEA